MKTQGEVQWISPCFSYLTLFDIVRRRRIHCIEAIAPRKEECFLNYMKELEPDKGTPLARLSDAEGTGCRCGRREEEGSAPGSVVGGCGSGVCGEHHLKACGFGVEEGVLAAVWVPFNRFDDLYDKETALRRGTMFAALDKPFYGAMKGVDCRGNER